ncbi:MAG: 50S ribosomal protein L9 [Planctomycetota bacterium]|jgi:large subunit ribosomal protein L9
MKVLLLADVGGSGEREAGQGVQRLGWRGDVVEVSSGYARNFLLPKGLAIEASCAPPALTEALAKEKAKRAEEIERERDQLEEIAAAVDGAEVVIAGTANEQGRLFGSVASSDIAANLAEQGFEVSADTVQLGEHIKQVGTYTVGLKFAENLTAAVSVIIVAKAENSGDEGDKEVD